MKHMLQQKILKETIVKDLIIHNIEKYHNHIRRNLVSRKFGIWREVN